MSKKYLIIGGTGSLGQHLCRHLIKDKNVRVRDITIMSRDEQKQVHMQRDSVFQDCKFIVHDIRDRDGIYDIVKGNDVVINCAAMKHIGKVELDVLEGIKTNLMGTYNVLKAVKRCERPMVYVGISTDKAPEATTMYGATKFLGEGLVRNFADSDVFHEYFCVRYGNVLESKGSVIPKFKELARNNHTIFVTDKRMTRFLMHLDDAVQLIMLTADHVAPTGAITLPVNLPSCNIWDLAGLIVESENSTSDIIEGSISRGEKLHEVLLSQTEIHDFKCLNLSETKNGINFAYIKIPDLSTYRDGVIHSYTSKDKAMTKDQLKRFLQRNGVI